MRILRVAARGSLAMPFGLGVLAWAVAFAVVGLVPSFQVERRDLVIAAGQAVPLLVASCLTWLVSRRVADQKTIWSWRLLSLASFASVIAVGGNALRDVAPEAQAVPIVEARSLWYLLAFLGLMLQAPTEKSKISSANWLVDSIMFALSVTGLCWQLVLAQWVIGSGRVPPNVEIVMWITGDLLLTFALGSRLLAQKPDSVQVGFLGLLGAFAIFVAADSLDTIVYLTVQSHPAYLTSTLFTLAYALMALAAEEHLRAASIASFASNLHRDTLRSKCVRIGQLLVRFSPLPAAALLLYLGHVESLRPSGEQPALALVFGAAVAILIGSRQMLALFENSKLASSLLVLSHDLEARVLQRTEELTRRTEQLEALNRVATELSQCISTKEAVLTGLNLACEATKAAVGTVWLLKPSGESDMAVQLLKSGDEPELKIQSGSEAALPAAIADLPQRSPQLRKAFAAGSPIVLHAADVAPLTSNGAAEVMPEGGLLVVPLLSRRTLVGAMGLAIPGQGSALSWESQLSRAIGAELGVAIENFRRFEEVKELADRDSVTGLLNHRAIHLRLDQELRRAQRTGQRFSVLMMDLDGFKLFNDTYGHQVGDTVLRQVAELLTQTARTVDVLGRYGGDEFVMILPDTNQDGAQRAAERLKSILAANPYTTPDGLSVPVRASIGIATYPYDARQGSELVAAADAYLYESKQVGGDVITVGTVSRATDITHVGQFSVLDGLVTAVDNRDHYTRRHSEDVTVYALGLARSMGLAEDAQATLRIAPLLHDVGKIGVPYRLLRKPGKLQMDEFEVFKQHVILGEMMIKDVPNISEVLSAVGSHHERFDGSGYPRGLRRDGIPVLGRLLAVADAYSAMTTDRPYRKALGPDEARNELTRVAGAQLDPEMVRVFLNVTMETSVTAKVVTRQTAS